VLAGLGLLAYALVVRAPGLFPLVIDHDESLYLVQAQHWIAGHLPYVAIWDHHPVGVPALFAAVQLVAGEGVYLVRLLATFFAFATAIVLYRCAAIMAGSRVVGLAAGLLYISYTALNGGLASNTEVFFLFWVSLGFYLLIRSTESAAATAALQLARVAAAGLSFGIALQLKYVAVFETAFAFLTFAGLSLWKLRHSIQNIVGTAFVFGVACAVPTVAIAIYFAAEGAFQAFFEANVLANFGYLASDLSAKETLGHIFFGSSVYAPLVLVLAYATLIARPSVDERRRTSLLWLTAWLVGAALGVIALRKFFNHHFLTLAAPLALLTALAAAWSTTAVFRDSFRRTGFWALVSLLLVPPLLLSVRPDALKNIREPGAPAEIANYLRQRMSPSSYLYVANYQPIIYYLVPARIPTRYILPSEVLDPNLHHADTGSELDAIFAKQPEFVVVARPSRLNAAPDETLPALDRYLEASYTLDRVFADHDGNQNMLVGVWRFTGTATSVLDPRQEEPAPQTPSLMSRRE
jgi:hypothetical protein